MNRLFISFSGGRTSALMTKRLLDARTAGQEIAVLFANTGLENEETLRFVDKCDRLLGFNVVWVEAVVDPKSGSGTTHKVVDFLTAARNGEPFEEAVKKYGIPNKNFPHCTRETKLRPMHSYLSSIGWTKGTYVTAVGIRADEFDRMASNAQKERLWYPLIEQGIRKEDVLEYWSRQPFDLRLREHWGNCETCWKKSDRKLLTIAKESPQAFGFMHRMERDFAMAGAGTGPRVFFRNRRTAADIVGRSMLEPFDPFVDLHPRNDPDLDVGAACGESCEIHADEGDES